MEHARVTPIGSAQASHQYSNFGHPSQQYVGSVVGASHLAPQAASHASRRTSLGQQQSAPGAAPSVAAATQVPNFQPLTVIPELRIPGAMPTEPGTAAAGNGNGDAKSQAAGSAAPGTAAASAAPAPPPSVYAQIVPFIFCLDLERSVKFYQRLGFAVVPTCSAETGEMNLRDDERILAPSDAPTGRRPKLCLRQLPANLMRRNGVLVSDVATPGGTSSQVYEIPALRFDYITPRVGEFAREFHDDLLKEVRSKPRQYHEFQVKDPDGTLITVWCNRSHMDKAASA